MKDLWFRTYPEIRLWCLFRHWPARWTQRIPGQVVSLLLMLLLLASCTHSVRQAEVAARGAEVMPFDLDKTTHIFEKNQDGGLQQVIVDDPNDADQIPLIRQHLAAEAERFANGDFHDPGMIHGDDMPGLSALIDGAPELRIEYSEIVDGGQIVYATDNPALVDAIHVWFDAQLSDHGNHAAEAR